MDEENTLVIKGLVERVEQVEEKVGISFGYGFTFDHKSAGSPYCSPKVLEDVWRWYREACDLVREALAGSRDSDHHEEMVKKLKNLDSRCLL